MSARCSAVSVALAETRGADLRVVNTAGKTLADVSPVHGIDPIQTDPGASCFGQGTGGSGDRVAVGGPTALGAVRDALGSDAGAAPRSRSPTRSQTRASGSASAGSAGYESKGSSFWYLKRNHVGAQVSGSQLKVHQGDDVLWYLSPSFPPPPELALQAPARAKPNVPFQVTVHSYADDGTRHPAAGASVTGAAAPTDAGGHTMVRARPGRGRCRATDSRRHPLEPRPRFAWPPNPRSARRPRRSGSSGATTPT